MTITLAIKNRIKYMPKGKPFSCSIFSEVGPRTSVDKALSRMVQSGFLERITRGVYMRPKVTKYVGQVRPSPTVVMRVIAKAKGEVIQIHGSEAVRIFNLSIQMQMIPTYYTSGPSREINVGNAVVRLQHVSRARLQHAGTRVGAALSALYYIGKDNLTMSSLTSIVSTLSAGEVKKLRTSMMPNWMRSAVLSAT
ncbi:DUF6088 family protein [Pseudomonas sp. MS19]|uniref:DUF6088 family protein n=1 Tax=Pseudomonas sp. MS19 TaxID=2579939 RepID=UPI0031F614BA